MPRVTIRTGFIGADGREEELSDFLCDVPDCPNSATEVVGCVEARAVTVLCREHAARKAPTREPRRDATE